jgi:hypothetical protein
MYVDVFIDSNNLGTNNYIWQKCRPKYNRAEYSSTYIGQDVHMYTKMGSRDLRTILRPIFHIGWEVICTYLHLFEMILGMEENRYFLPGVSDKIFKINSPKNMFKQKIFTNNIELAPVSTEARSCTRPSSTRLRSCPVSFPDWPPGVKIMGRFIVHFFPRKFDFPSKVKLIPLKFPRKKGTKNRLKFKPDFSIYQIKTNQVKIHFYEF